MVKEGYIWNMKCRGGYDEEKSGRKMVQRRVYMCLCVWERENVPLECTQ